MRVGISIPYTLLKRTGGAALAKKTFTKIERVRERERERVREREKERETQKEEGKES